MKKDKIMASIGIIDAVILTGAAIFTAAVGFELHQPLLMAGGGFYTLFFAGLAVYYINRLRKLQAGE